jgi:fructose-1,6-bisphosphatase/inositol monophosphatase family enzyme
VTKRDHLQACRQLCRQFGGQLAVVSQTDYDAMFNSHAGRHRARTHLDGELHEAPFTSFHGLHWNRKIVYTVCGHEEVGSIIHEMGHVFAGPLHPDHPQCSEWDWFGWEIAIARQIGAVHTWSGHNRNYCINDDGKEWGKLSAKQRRALTAERLAYARKIGILDTTGTPRNIR